MPSAPIGWAGHLWPPSLTITIDANASQTVYAQVWVDGVTNAAGQGPGVLAQFAYGTSGSDPATWTWQPMVYNTDVGNNDEYRDRLHAGAGGPLRLPGPLQHGPGLPLDHGLHGFRLAVAIWWSTPRPTSPRPPRRAHLHRTGSSATSISIGWDANAEPDLYRYEVWRGSTSGGPYSKIGNVPAGTMTYTDNGLTTGATYYYVLTAQDTSFNRSPNSDEVAILADAQMVAVTFNVTVPDTGGRTVHIAGSFPAPYPQWDPASLPMTQADATHWTITLTIVEGTNLEYKYVLGDWNYVEKGAACEELGNRTMTVVYSPSGQTQTDTVLNWHGLGSCIP